MKKLLATLTLAITAATVAPVMSAATAKTFNVLCIDRVDGVQERLKLDSDMKVTMSGVGTILITHPQITVEYTVDEVSSFTFDKETDPELYVGDHEAGIIAPEAPGRTIVITESAVTISGSDAITLYNTKGVEVARAASNGSEATLRTAGLPAGIYILQAGNTTLKIRL